MPNSLENIGGYAFFECEKLPIPPLPSSLIIIGDCAFGYMGTPYSESQDLIIPDLVTSIGAAAFYGRKLKSIILGHSLENIGENAFYGIGNKLDEIRIPRSVTSIGACAFFSNSNNYPSRVIVENEIPFNITGDSFRTGTGAACKTLYVPIGSKAAYEAANNWQICFKEIIEMANITFADANVKALCIAANWDTDGDGELTEIEAAAVTSLGEVFKGNTQITSFDELQYFTGLTEISEKAFENCTSLTSVKLPSTVTIIEPAAFMNCRQLESIDFNGCKAIIKYDAFANCINLVNVTLPSGTYLEGHNFFWSCTSLKSFVMEPSDNLPDAWPGGTFDLCTNLETAVVYGKVLRGPNNFHKCTSLQTVTYLDSTPGTTYNQNFGEAAPGIQFIIPEGSAETFLRQGYVNLSDKGALPIAREEFEDEVARIEVMATAAGSNTTALSLAISEARTIVNNATDYPTVFAQIAAVKEAAREYLTTAALKDEVDVTAAYVTNPDITRFDIGWQLTSGWITAGYQTASYTNGNVSIDHFDEMWKGLGDGALPDGKISQTISQLPAGLYRLEADIIATNQNDANDEVAGISLFAGSKNTGVFTENGKPQHFCVEFNNSATQNLEIGINIANTTANWVAADNFRLYYLGHIEFADANVKALCVANWDTSGDGELSETEAAAVTSLGEVFKGNTQITSFNELQYFTGLTAIDANAFNQCSQLESVVLPEGLQTIGEHAFRESGLNSISFPSTLTEVGECAFRDARNLTTIDISGCSANFEYECFMGCTSLQELYIPKTVQFKNSDNSWTWNAFGWCSSLKRVVFEAFDEGQQWSTTSLFSHCMFRSFLMISNIMLISCLGSIIL